MRTTTLRKYKFVIIATVLAIVGCGLLVYFAPFGARKYLSLRRELSQINAEISDLKAQNRILTKEVTRLKKDTAYSEKVAREQYGLLKKNEVVFEFKEKREKGR